MTKFDFETEDYDMQKKLSAPINTIKNFITQEKYIGKSIDFDVLNVLGVFILKNVFSKSTIDSYRDMYFNDKNLLNRTPFHLTEMTFDSKHLFNNFLSEEAFIHIVSNFFNGNVGCYSIRIIKKDSIDTKPVFLHQDVGYHIGGFDRYSFFVPLTTCTPNNGGLILYPGTHNFGYLGDVGEINRDILPNEYPKIMSNTQPSDLIVMHSAVWHESPANNDLTDRVYIDIHIQDANETSSKNIICGERTSEWSNQLSGDEIFINSRTQRLKSLYQQVNEITIK
jgi:hypothetical protein